MPLDTGPDECPRCLAPLAADAAVCMNCGYNRRTGFTEKTSREVELSRSEELKQRLAHEGLDSLKDFEIPLGILIVGFVLVAIVAFFDAGKLSSPGGFGIWARIQLVLLAEFAAVIWVVISTGWMGAACAAVELWTGGEFGPLPQQLLKLASVAMISLIVHMLMGLAAPLYGWLLAGFVMLPLTYFLMMWLFELDGLWAAGMVILFLIANVLAGLAR